MTKASSTPQFRVAAYCRIAGGEEQNTILESQRTYYTKRIGANPDWIMAGCLSIVRELRELGVTVIFEKENISTTAPDFDALTSLMADLARAECEHLTKNSAHMHYMGTISRPTKKTWKKTIRLPGRPEKTITFRME